jgi:hypothetical protein
MSNTTKPARSHKSKKEQRKKSTVRMHGGFMERTRKPVITGEGDLKSRMIRVDADFAEYLRRTAMKEGVSLTAVTRNLYLSGILNG